MTPQSAIMVAAAIIPERENALRDLLATMNVAPGVANPDNALVPFRQFERLHFARFVILRDATLPDLAAYGKSFPDAPVWLVFLGDCDGPAEAQLAELAQHAEAGLRLIFSHCRDFTASADLAGWMRAHAVASATLYVNWVGRTVRQVREEAALHAALRGFCRREAASLAGAEPRAAWRRLAAFALAEQRAGRLVLSAEPPTPPGWRARQLLDLVGVPLVLLLCAPLLLFLPVFLLVLRRHERRDPVIAPRPDPAHVRALTEREDHDVSNQFSAFGSVKPGRFRLWTLMVAFRVLGYGTRHLYARGHLARVSTIHFARWVFLDGNRRLLFASSYDGSLDSYMDDFINKVAWGLNLVFSNGVGYPRTAFLILGGAKDEQAFKNYIRRHELPTEVWYKAYPGLTTVDLARNTRIRRGVARRDVTEAEARAWLALI